MTRSRCAWATAMAVIVASGAAEAGPAAAAAPMAHRFQFGDGAARPGHVRVAPDLIYMSGHGYGFEPAAPATVSFSVALPEGNYRVTVTLGDPVRAAVTTVWAETRRLMLERVHTRAGGLEKRSFMVNVRGPRISSGGEVVLDTRERDLATGAILARHWDDKLTLAFGDEHAAVAALEIERVEDVITLFLVGDSTVTDQATPPASSWGQRIPRWFTDKVAVANHAESGETLRGFLEEHRWEKVLDSVKPGDYVLIEFGTNDSKDHGPQNMYPGQDFAETYAPAETTYKELLRRFIGDVRGKGAFPIVASPSARREEVAPPTSLGAYAVAAMEAARELGVPKIDLNSMGVALNVALGTQSVQQFADRTHHVEYGSELQARCIVEGLRQAKLPLARFVRKDFGRFDPQHPEAP